MDRTETVSNRFSVSPLISIKSPTTTDFAEFERVLTMPSAYISSLQKLIETQSPPPQPSNLKQRFLEWYRSGPEFARNRRFAMSEIEVALKTQGKYISPVLLELGWQRKRIWSTTGPYHRVWVPPLHSEQHIFPLEESK
jgi:hypothetical protein